MGRPEKRIVRRERLRGKHVLMTMLVFLATAFLAMVFLAGSTLIPREAIRERMLQSAEYLCEEKDQFAPFVENVNSTRIDRYADAILLGISWQYDARDPICSILVSSYYHNAQQKENQNLLDAVKQDLPANQQYLRYWHGSAGIVRILMTFLSLPQIYVWHGVILSLLATGLLIRLALRRAWTLALGILAGLVGTACWLVPLSLEFTWIYLMMLVQVHLILTPAFSCRWSKRCLFLLVSGMVTCFLDFLTCETLTLLVPILLFLRLDEKKGLPSGKTLAKAMISWAIGYGGMYLLKWGLAGVVMKENPFPYITAHVQERLVGSVEHMNLFQLAVHALIRNITSLFPLDYDLTGALIGAAVAITIGYIGYVYHRKDFDRRRVLVYSVLGLIPYARFLLITNHSYLHSFFTYRAQFSTILALTLILSELTGWGRVPYGKR